MMDLQFEQEVLAFARLKQQLLRQYPGRVVGIYQGQVVAVGDNRLDVLDQVWDQFGEVSCYIETVESVTPRPDAFCTNLQLINCNMSQSLVSYNSISNPSS